MKRAARHRAIEGSLVLVVLALGVVVVRHEMAVPSETAAHPTAVALMEEGASGAAWPPHATSLEISLPVSEATAAITRQAASDAGDPEERDAWPPLPDPPPDTPGLRVRREERDGILYLEAILGSADPEAPLPMVVVLHGRGARAEIPGGPFLGLTHPVRVIVPQAPDAFGGGYEWLPVYVGQGLVDRLSSSLFAQATRVAALVRAIAAERPTIGRPIFSGFSQGALVTIAIALHHDDVVSEAFPLACWLPAPLEPRYRRGDLSFPRIRSMHGTDDATIPLAPTAALFDRLAQLGFDVSLRTFPGVGHEITDAQNALFHLWLEAAVCRNVLDASCEAAAERASTEDVSGAVTGAEDADLPTAADGGSPSARDASRSGRRHRR